jgi:hypothetical protein
MEPAVGWISHLILELAQQVQFALVILVPAHYLRLTKP